MIFRHPVRDCDCACPFQLWGTISISRQILYTRACPPPPVSFHPPTYPPFFAHPPRKRSSSVLLLRPALDFLFSLNFFFFLNHQPFIPADRHPSWKHVATDRQTTPFVRVFCTHQNAPHQKKTPLLSHTPSFRHTLSSCSGLRSGQFPGRVPAIISPGGYPTRGNETSRTFGRIQFRFFQHLPYVTVVSAHALS